MNNNLSASLDRLANELCLFLDKKESVVTFRGLPDSRGFCLTSASLIDIENSGFSIYVPNISSATRLEYTPRKLDKLKLWRLMPSRCSDRASVLVEIPFDFHYAHTCLEAAIEKIGYQKFINSQLIKHILSIAIVDTDSAIIWGRWFTYLFEQLSNFNEAKLNTLVSKLIAAVNVLSNVTHSFDVEAKEAIENEVYQWLSIVSPLPLAS